MAALGGRLTLRHVENGFSQSLGGFCQQSETRGGIVALLVREQRVLTDQDTIP